jgi:C4-dicarboxylate-specific signal transduction histidine kinase
MTAAANSSLWHLLRQPGSREGAHLILAASLVLVALIGYADFLTGYNIRLAVLYLVPISWTTWRLGGISGGGMAVASAICWMVTFESTHPYSHPVYFYWEGSATAATFLIVVLLLARLRRALRRSDERFVTVLDGLDAAVQVLDGRTGAPLFDNLRFRERFGVTPAFAQDTGEAFDTASGRWYLIQTRPLRWIDGRIATLRMLSDITEEHRGRELLAKQREAAHRTSRLVALGEFASAIAHELNQPLAAIATYNDACLRLLARSDSQMEAGPRDPAELREAMQKCREQAKRAGAIIQRLREVLRQPVPARASLDLNEVAVAALQLAETEALEAGVALHLEAGAGLPPVRTDRLLVEQVALNLVRNAIEAVEHLAPERRRVTIATAAEDDGRVTLTVSDLGEGVSAEVREKLFEAFVTTKTAGLGLGLSICRSVVESLGGAIRYHANGAGGARFSFSLPAGA